MHASVMKIRAVGLGMLSERYTVGRTNRNPINVVL